MSLTPAKLVLPRCLACEGAITRRRVTVRHVERWNWPPEGTCWRCYFREVGRRRDNAARRARRHMEDRMDREEEERVAARVMSAAEIDALSRSLPTIRSPIRPRAIRRCEVPGCSKRHSAKGKCAQHYLKAKRGKIG